MNPDTTDTNSSEQSKFKIKLDDGTALPRDSLVAHVKYGPMRVDQITVSATSKRARLKAEGRQDGLSIELTAAELREQWGDTVANDRSELRDGPTRYENEFASDDDAIAVTISVSGPEPRAGPVMAHLHDQTSACSRLTETSARLRSAKESTTSTGRASSRMWRRRTDVDS
jgi:hypothetical protein